MIESDQVGRQELEIVIGDEHISFTTSKIGRWTLSASSVQVRCKILGFNVSISVSAVWLTSTSPEILTGFAVSTIQSRSVSTIYFLLSSPGLPNINRIICQKKSFSGLEVPGVLPHWSPFQDQADLNQTSKRRTRSGEDQTKLPEQLHMTFCKIH